MKAVRIHSYGTSEVLQLEEISIPDIAADEVLIKVVAASINPVDWKVRAGYLKLMNVHKLPLILGWDVAGIIEKTGSEVTNFKPGDQVYSRPALERNGSYTEFMTVKANEVAFKPTSITFEEAASIPLAGITAWESLVTTAAIQPGQKVLIHAASGGVGTLAVQIAKAKGCYVIGTTSAANIDLVKRLGADEVIDYKTQDFSQLLTDIDVVFDTIGGKTQDDSWKVLKKGGILVSITVRPKAQTAKEYNVRSGYVFIKPNVPVLNELTNLIDSGQLKPVIGATFSLDDIKKAHELSETGRAKGKIVIKVR